MSQEFTFESIDETRNYFLKEIKQNELMSQIHKKVSTTLNCICNSKLYWKHFYFRFYNY